MDYNSSQKIIAEALGTGLLLATIVGSGIMAETLSSGNIALALLANVIAIGAMLYVLITTLGPVSGAHLNPAVSTVFALRGDLPWKMAGLFIVAQIIGGIIGTLTAHAMFDQAIIQVSIEDRSGVPLIFSEAVATFALIFTILMTLRARPAAVPAAVALVITAACWFTASTSFANPAVTIARIFTDTFTGISATDAIPFVLIQFVGAALAWWLADRILAPGKTK
ncbi:MAG: MIP/aquaporin family protein [Pseudomonadota bacterium]